MPFFQNCLLEMFHVWMRKTLLHYILIPPIRLTLWFGDSEAQKSSSSRGNSYSKLRKSLKNTLFVATISRIFHSQIPMSSALFASISPTPLGKLQKSNLQVTHTWEKNLHRLHLIIIILIFRPLGTTTSECNINVYIPDTQCLVHLPSFTMTNWTNVGKYNIPSIECLGM